MEQNSKIYVAGHRGMVGSAIVRELERQGYTNIITRTHKELDLTRQEAVQLPSTSPANAAWSVPRLIEAWRILRAPSAPAAGSPD